MSAWWWACWVAVLTVRAGACLSSVGLPAARWRVRCLGSTERRWLLPWLALAAVHVASLPSPLPLYPSVRAPASLALPALAVPVPAGLPCLVGRSMKLLCPWQAFGWRRAPCAGGAGPACAPLFPPSLPTHVCLCCASVEGVRLTMGPFMIVEPGLLTFVLCFRLSMCFRLSVTHSCGWFSLYRPARVSGAACNTQTDRQTQSGIGGCTAGGARHGA